MVSRLALLSLLIALLAAGALADEPAPPLKATTKDAFSAVVAGLHKEMQEGGRYAYITEREREDIEKNLDRMRALFEKSGSVDTMGKDDQVALFNAQESVNATLEKRDRDRLICERAATTGSRIATTQCRTYGEIEADREAGKKLMREKAARGCTKPGCKQG